MLACTRDTPFPKSRVDRVAIREAELGNIPRARDVPAGIYRCFVNLLLLSLTFLRTEKIRAGDDKARRGIQEYRQYRIFQYRGVI